MILTDNLYVTLDTEKAFCQVEVLPPVVMLNPQNAQPLVAMGLAMAPLVHLTFPGQEGGCGHRLVQRTPEQWDFATALEELQRQEPGAWMMDDGAIVGLSRQGVNPLEVLGLDRSPALA